MPEDLQSKDGRSQRLKALQAQLKNELGGKQTYKQFQKPIVITTNGIKKTLHQPHARDEEKLILRNYSGGNQECQVCDKCAQL